VHTPSADPQGNPAFWDVLEQRRTIRFYADAPVADADIERLLQAAILAPSAHNTQAWRFAVLKDRATRVRLVSAMAARWERDLVQSGAPEKVIAAELRFSRERFTNAPGLVLACLTMEQMDAYPDAGRRRAEHLMGVQSVAAGIQNLLLAAHALGLGACWCCAPLFCQGLVRRTLKLPASWEPQALITLGVPGHHAPVPPRKPAHEVIRVL
jgi:F420 biosynthesis protein FbiB-like protein